MKSLVCCLCVLVCATAYRLNDERWNFLREEAPSAIKRDDSQGCYHVADIGLVIDSSRSIVDADYKKGLEFVADFAEGFDIGPDDVRFSAITFSRGVHEEDAIRFDQFTKKKALIDALKSLPHREGDYTATGEGIEYMRTNLMPEARDDVAHFGIVITDGNSQEWEKTAEEAQKARDDGIVMIAIGVGKVNDEELERIASGPQFILRAESYSDLSSITASLTHLACKVLTTPVPQVVTTPVPETCYQVADFGLVIDSSRSIHGDDFQKGLQFIADFVDGFTIGPDSVRFSAITFSEGIHEEDAIPFNKFTNKKALINAIKRLPHREGGYTATGKGIEYMRDVLMPDAREDVAHFGIVITDGNSQEWEETEDEARQAREDGIVMIAIGVGKVNDEELERIASGPHFILRAESYSDLQSIKASLVHLACKVLTTPSGCK